MSQLPDVYEEHIELNEAVEINHRNYLIEFDEKVWPIFEQRGYKKDTALLFWMLNRAVNTLDSIEAILLEEPDADGGFET